MRLGASTPAVSYEKLPYEAYLTVVPALVKLAQLLRQEIECTTQKLFKQETMTEKLEFNVGLFTNSTVLTFQVEKCLSVSQGMLEAVGEPFSLLNKYCGSRTRSISALD